MISWDRVSLDWGWGIVSLTLVLDISNIARVSISHIVGDNLGAAVRKGNTVLAVGGVAITSLILTKVGARVLISHTILVSVDSRAIISWLLVAVDRLGWVVWSWGWPVSWDNRLVHNWGRVVDWGNHWLVNDWGSVVDWGWLVNNGSWVVDRCWLVDNGGRVVDRGWVVWGWLVDWHVGWSMHSSAVLLSGVRVVHVLGSGMGLLGNDGSVGAVGLVDRVAHSGGIAVLDDLVVGLVSGSSGQESRDSDKSLERIFK